MKWQWILYDRTRYWGIMMGAIWIRITMCRWRSGWGQLNMNMCLTFRSYLLLLSSHTMGKPTGWWNRQFSTIRLTLPTLKLKVYLLPFLPPRPLDMGPSCLLTTLDFLFLNVTSLTFRSIYKGYFVNKIRNKRFACFINQGELIWELDNSYRNCSHTWFFFFNSAKMIILISPWWYMLWVGFSTFFLIWETILPKLFQKWNGKLRSLPNSKCASNRKWEALKVENRPSQVMSLVMITKGLINSSLIHSFENPFSPFTAKNSALKT